MITIDDYKKIGILANHCDLSKLDIAGEEAINFDLPELVCNLNIEWDSEDPRWINLINGGVYEGCTGKQYRHRGLKTALVYYAYSRYIILNGFDDTPNGMVSKTNEFSLPKPLKELESFSEKYRNMGYVTFMGVSSYICVNRDFFDNISGIECTGCGCGRKDCKYGVATKGFGLNVRIIRK